MLPTLSNTQLDSLFENKEIYSNSYLGCFAKDELKKIKPKTKFAVINNADADKPGTHWTCFYCCPNQDEILIFDSMGAPPATDIHTYCSKVAAKTGKKMIINKRQLQNLGTDSCGWFCIYVLNHLFAGHTFEDILNTFSSNPSQNEHGLYKYFEDSINALQEVAKKS